MWRQALRTGKQSPALIACRVVPDDKRHPGQSARREHDGLPAPAEAAGCIEFAGCRSRYVQTTGARFSREGRRIGNGEDTGQVPFTAVQHAADQSARSLSRLRGEQLDILIAYHDDAIRRAELGVYAAPAGMKA